MSRLIKYWATGAVLALVLAAQAMAATINGQVVDASTGNPVADANVTVVGMTGVGASTGLSGSFKLEGLEAGKEYSLSISRLAYQQKEAKAVAGGAKIVVKIEPTNLKLSEVVVTMGRGVPGETPGALTNVDHKDLETQNSVVEPPFIATLIPNSTSFNWGGGTLAATHLRIRGFDMDKESVTVNGVPLTDPEDHISYWQDTPDLLSNVHDIQIERGVSAFASGPSGMAGGLNITTSDAVATREADLTIMGGDYNTSRRTFAYRSGIVDGTYNYTGRFSRVASEGYRDHSGGVEWSYFLGATRYDPNLVTNLETWGGEEITDLDFTAVEKGILDTNRTWNPEANYDLRINGQRYDGEKDHYQQPHYVLSNKWRASPDLTFEHSLYWIKGNGYYEEFKGAQGFSEYNLTPFYRYGNNNGQLDSTLIESSDLIRQKYVDKNEIGWMPKLNWRASDADEVNAGLELRDYYSHHYGKLIWVRDMPPGALASGPDNIYYSWNNKKLFTGGWGNIRHKFDEQFSMVAGLEVRHIGYKVDRDTLVNYSHFAYNENWTFINPRVGATYDLNPRTTLYASVAMSGLEPTDPQMFDADNPLAIYTKVNPQRMTDIEAGGNHTMGKVTVGANLYAMLFKDEIVYTGQWDANTEESVVANAPTSQHLGIELTGAWTTPLEGLSLNGDISFDHSTFGDFNYHYVDSVDGNWNYIDQTVNVKGNEIPLTPSYVANLHVKFAQGHFSGMANWQGVSRQYLDPRQDNRWSLDPYGAVGASLAYDLPVKGITFGFRVDGLNLLNAKYFAYGWTQTSDNAVPGTRGNYVPMFIPASGRMILGGVTVKM